MNRDVVSCPYLVTMMLYFFKRAKQGVDEYEIVLIFRGKHENEVEAQQSEILPVEQKCQSLFT